MISLKNVLQAFAVYMQKYVPVSVPSDTVTDYLEKAQSYSVSDILSGNMANLITMFSTIEAVGNNARAKWLNNEAFRFSTEKFTLAVQTEFNTGECIIVPSVVDGALQNVLIDADNYNITSQRAGAITGIEYVADTYRTKTATYYLCVDMQYAEGVNTYRLKVSQNGTFGAVGLSVNPGWENLTEEFSIGGVDRLLIGRFKSLAVDPCEINSLKGKPICVGASEPVREIKRLYRALSDEFGFSEKMIFADKTLFTTKNSQYKAEDGTIKTTNVTALPKGKDRLITSVAGNMNIEANPLIHDWAPDIRVEKYIEGIEAQLKLLEKCVGVSEGIVSKSSSEYINVDNVRKSQQQTMAFVDSNRKSLKPAINDLVYAWDALADYFGITPKGSYELTIDFSDEYIETFADRMNQLIQGFSIGAASAVDYRMWAFDETEDVAKARVDEVAQSRLTIDNTV